MKNKERMPAIFIGHGSPENAFESNEFSETWQQIASSFVKPKGIVVISAHWTNRLDEKVKETSITSSKKLETIHDFYGFPENFYEFSYNTPGHEKLVEKIIANVKTIKIKRSNEWGLDHGAWSVLAKMYPEADIPVVQVSIDEELAREKLFAIGQELSGLRDDGFLILGSGNIVHNLREIVWQGKPYDWALEFDEFIKDALTKRDTKAIINFENNPLSKLALPTVEHFLPLLYVVGASKEEKAEFFCEKIFAASLSMRCVIYR
ncbi:MAG: 4,5-DOPA dioxygenase extradiol [Candidatus Falkowbacteria bacterium]|nr:4,5-DOPA dioxygenase extradiol [Candidatus Falkowbacteria bacterium]